MSEAVRNGIVALVNSVPVWHIMPGQVEATDARPFRTEDGIVLPTVEVDAMLMSGQLVLARSVGACPTDHGFLVARRVRIPQPA